MKLNFWLNPFPILGSDEGIFGSDPFLPYSPFLTFSMTELASKPAQAGPPLEGTEGEDYIEGTDGDDVIYGYGGDDYLRSFDGDDEIYGGYGDDEILSQGGSNTIHGGAGNDTLVAFDGSDARPSTFADWLYGDAGDDILNGYAGDDVLDGGDDNDILVGGTGDDFLTGGTGADTFTFSRVTVQVSTPTVPAYVPVSFGNDIISDFDPTEDIINLLGLGSRSLGQAAFTGAVQSGADVILTIGGDSPGTITLQNTDLGNLSESNFIFFPLVLQDDYVTVSASGSLTANVLDDNGNGADVSYGAPIQGMYGTFSPH